jgi:hypothetical protein
VARRRLELGGDAVLRPLLGFTLKGPAAACEYRRGIGQARGPSGGWFLSQIGDDYHPLVIGGQRPSVFPIARDHRESRGQ